VKPGRAVLGVAPDLPERGAGIADVNADRKVEIFGNAIEGIKIWVVHGPVAFESAQMYADRTAVLAPGDLLERLVHVLQRRLHHPAQPPVAAAAAIGEKAVIGPRERQFHGGRFGRERQEQAREDDVHVDALQVHGLETLIGIGHAEGPGLDLSAGEFLDHLQVGAGVQLPVDGPHRGHGRLYWGHHDPLVQFDRLRAMNPLLLGHVLPDRGGLDQVGIGVDNFRHGIIPVNRETSQDRR